VLDFDTHCEKELGWRGGPGGGGYQVGWVYDDNLEAVLGFRRQILWGVVIPEVETPQHLQVTVHIPSLSHIVLKSTTCLTLLPSQLGSDRRRLSKQAVSTSTGLHYIAMTYLKARVVLKEPSICVGKALPQFPAITQSHTIRSTD